MSLITINGNSFDPEAPAVRSFGLNKEDAADTDYILIQTAGEPLKKAQKIKLDEKGVKILEYFGNDTYLCSYKDKSDFNTLRELPYVKYANVYLQEFVVQPSLKTALDPSASAIGLAAIQKTRIAKDVDIVLHNDVEASQDIIKTIAGAAHVDADELAITPGKKLRLAVQEQYLDDLAAIDAVKYVQEVHPVKLHNNVARKILNADVDINNTPYKGKGQIVCVADTGFDTGNDSKSGIGHHKAFGDRVQELWALGRPGKKDDPDGHGTHVCGSVLGDGDHSSEGHIEAPASEATLVMQSLLDSSGGLRGIPDDLNELFQQAYDAGARIHTNSWGSTSRFGTQLPYDSTSTNIDDFVNKHPSMVILFAAGNDGADKDKNGKIDAAIIGSQAAAKNCITVGATESLRPDIKWKNPGAASFTFPKLPFFNDHMANNPDGMAAFSSLGPTTNRRLKPDIVAPGSSILSTLSSKVLKVFGISDDPGWWYCSGTSMATPLVAGCCAVLRETLIKNNGIAEPSAALIKAVLLNGAVDVLGQHHPSEAGQGPNSICGFGRVNVKNSVIPKDSKLAGCGDSEKPLDDDDEFTFTIDIPEKVDNKERGSADEKTTMAPAGAAARTLKVTLAWSDPPGEELQNDLDLIVKASDGTERHGNMGTRRGFDRLNNVEQVLWDGIPPGVTEVKIRAHRITVEKQRFAWAWKIY
ncbi:subtilisin-like protease [Cenococcum geophilum 1.58]|uniref:subtilisin-like protease n=1 Tax=Cenococcum geophilum 1.58 TaxID=794803 RepID=UPI00358F378C|nr:subtilisin-like protease [Cenococcum geophilum 1.58]